MQARPDIPGPVREQRDQLQGEKGLEDANRRR
jgi:hypothetical protein